MLETSFSYTTISSPKIQIIKRIYSSPEQVIGGFDLDPSRFFMNTEFEIYCTVGAFISLQYRMNPINFNSYSSTFTRRISKYSKKGFINHFFFFFFYFFIFFSFLFYLFFFFSFILIFVFFSNCKTGFKPIFVNKKKENECCPKHNRRRYRYNWRRRTKSTVDEFLNKDPYYFEDYSVELSNLIGVSLEEKMFKLNFSCLVRKVKYFCFYFKYFNFNLFCFNFIFDSFLF